MLLAGCACTQKVRSAKVSGRFPPVCFVDAYVLFCLTKRGQVSGTLLPPTPSDFSWLFYLFLIFIITLFLCLLFSTPLLFSFCFVVCWLRSTLIDTPVILLVTSAVGPPAASSPSPAGSLGLIPVFSLASTTVPSATIASFGPSAPVVTHTTPATSVLPPTNWAALLAQQLTPGAMPQPSRALPLILSPALPPIPGKLVEKIRKGENPDLKDMLSDNIALAKRLNEAHQAYPSPLHSGSKFREVTDPLSWVFCFLNFMAVKSEDPETRGLIAYAQIVLDLARKHGGTGWLAYDTHFRAQLFAGGPFKWNEINPSLLASAVLGNPQLGEGAQSCTRCMAADHSASVCAVSSLDPPPRPAHLVPNRPSPVRQASWPYSPTQPRAGVEEPCRRYNKGLCSARSCRYEHYCNTCFKGAHPAIDCWSKDSKGKRGSEEASSRQKASS